ncbi:homoserine kinase [Pyrinomonas sp.]|uniref:homoserine kinase n=1 Tax=Pyrinomonas sp. TaxID=2080306 RepID=UPI003316998D
MEAEINITETIDPGIDGRAKVEVRVPASTSNLGSGFDCCGLALDLYLQARATTVESAPRLRIKGEGATLRVEENLIQRAMRFVAERRGWELPPVRLAVRSQIPLASGLGSSGAAIVAGIALGAAICRKPLSTADFLRYATELEGHADNVAAALLGGWVVHCINPDGSVLAVKRPWPSTLKIIVVTPDVPLETKRARAALPDRVDRADAVFNMQRVALLCAAVESGEHHLLWEAMRDRLHQPYRRNLVPGLDEALDVPRVEGLLGVALSGAGPSVIALTDGREQEIAELIALPFRRRGIKTAVRFPCVDVQGLVVRRLDRKARDSSSLAD